MRIARTVFYLLLYSTFAMWFGGFGFYASIVVPIGNEVLGSFEQATVTRQVTKALNVFGAISIAFIALDVGLSWKNAERFVKFTKCFVVLVLVAGLVFLVQLHPRIEAHMNLDEGVVAGEYQDFYFLHRCYLWGITVQWIAAWIWLIVHSWEIVTGRTDPKGATNSLP